MTLFANILLAALSIVSPEDGATVPTLRNSQKAYLAYPRGVRFKALVDADVRQMMATCGEAQQPLLLRWAGDTNAVYTLTIARDGGERQEFAVMNTTRAYITNLELGAKYLWTVTVRGRPDESASAVFLTEPTAPRLLRAGGVYNLRDLGGWKGLGGRKVRQNMIFRSAGLRASARQNGGSLVGGTFSPGETRITPSGIATLRDEFGVKTDLELRNSQEAACMTSSVLGPDVRWVHVPFAAYDFIDNPVRGREPFQKIFRTFIDKANYPILFHCSGGRDRTGTLAFVLNGLLGVDGDDLCRDWESTVFTEDSLNFGPDRLGRLLRYLGNVGGATVAEQCERYALSCGITRDEITKFREIMLESAD